MKNFLKKIKFSKVVNILVATMMLFAIIPPARAMAAGTKTISDVTRVTRQGLIDWLTSHESDAYYLTTPYKPYDWRSPNGDPNNYGDADWTPGMNCTGFVWHTLTKAGGSGVPALSNPRWWTWIVNNDIEHYDFVTKEEMLSSGILEKGDIIWIWDENVGRDNLSDFHHVGFFWGNTSSDDLFWHSIADNVISWIGYNRISDIHGKVSPVSYTVLKLQNSGYIDLTKHSANTTISTGNACYSLQGAVYTIYRDLECTQVVATMTTDGTGYATQSISLPVTTYYVKETSPALGYALDSVVYPVQVIQGQTTRVNTAAGGVVYDKPQNNTAIMFSRKIDSETTSTTPQGKASFENAHFEIKYYDGYYSTTDQSWIAGATPKRVWVVKTDINGMARLSDDYIVSGDSFYHDASGMIITLPLGTVTIQEIKTSEGYLLGNQPIFIQQITSNNSLEFAETFNAPEVPEQVKRGDLKLIKAEANTFNRLANVQFKITSKTTGENHIIITDSNGFASTEASWNPHTQNTNRGQSDEDGVWFGEINAIRNDVGALPYDTYIINELRGSLINFRPLIPPFDITISRDSYTVDLGTLLNEAPIVPQIGTTTLDGYTGGKYVSADVETTITDTVSYSNLISNNEYTIVGVLMDKDTGTPIQVNNRDVRVEQTFMATDTTPTTSGTIDMTFTFDASSLGGKDVVIFEYIYYEDTLIGSHEDLDDDDRATSC